MNDAQQTWREAHCAVIDGFADEYRSDIAALNGHFGHRMRWDMLQTGGMCMAIAWSSDGEEPREILIGGSDGPLTDSRNDNGLWSMSFVDYSTGGNDPLFAADDVATISELITRIELGLRTVGWPEARQETM